ncbi:hypothetical protein, partial [Streptomyces scabiei]|uniref:hypothetical protein n=1 Tax=Streptomyces scabiei TaxID=1930 RepID=UPI001F23D557
MHRHGRRLVTVGAGRRLLAVRAGLRLAVRTLLAGVAVAGLRRGRLRVAVAGALRGRGALRSYSHL